MMLILSIYFVLSSIDYGFKCDVIDKYNDCLITQLVLILMKDIVYIMILFTVLDYAVSSIMRREQVFSIYTHFIAIIILFILLITLLIFTTYVKVDINYVVTNNNFMSNYRMISIAISATLMVMNIVVFAASKFNRIFQR